MPSIGNQIDDVNGTIVGGNYGRAWVTYDGRQQGEIFYPSNEMEAVNLCEGLIQRIKDECGQVFDVIYPNKTWRINLDGI